MDIYIVLLGVYVCSSYPIIDICSANHAVYVKNIVRVASPQCHHTCLFPPLSKCCRVHFPATSNTALRAP